MVNGVSGARTDGGRAPTEHQLTAQDVGSAAIAAGGTVLIIFGNLQIAVIRTYALPRIEGQLLDVLPSLGLLLAQ